MHRTKDVGQTERYELATGRCGDKYVGRGCLPVLAEAHFVAERLVAQLARERPLAVVRAPRVHLESVGRREHLLALHARVDVAQRRDAGPHEQVVVVQVVLMLREAQVAGGGRRSSVGPLQLRLRHEAAEAQQVLVGDRPVATGGGRRAVRCARLLALVEGDGRQPGEGVE